MQHALWNFLVSVSLFKGLRSTFNKLRAESQLSKRGRIVAPLGIYSGIFSQASIVTSSTNAYALASSIREFFNKANELLGHFLDVNRADKKPNRRRKIVCFSGSEEKKIISVCYTRASNQLSRARVQRAIFSDGRVRGSTTRHSFQRGISSCLPVWMGGKKRAESKSRGEISKSLAQRVACKRYHASPFICNSLAIFFLCARTNENGKIMNGNGWNVTDGFN